MEALTTAATLTAGFFTAFFALALVMFIAGQLCKAIRKPRRLDRE